MADKPPTQFERRSRGSAPPSRPQPAKRSHEVVLLVMGSIAVGSTAYALMPRECTPAQPGTMPTVSSPSECPPRGSSSSSHGSSGGRYGYSSGGSSGSTPAATTDASSGGIKRGGFGSFAHSFSSHFSFGG
ncbi:hypothetical protein [Bradyrhizobium sp.]|uniref:hypothetical protein n=1 Tax=Bradyrhizobium sp. TaxID=376 RepID=UPI0040384AB5